MLFKRGTYREREIDAHLHILRDVEIYARRDRHSSTQTERDLEIHGGGGGGTERDRQR